MLVLTRKPGERIIIGDDIVVTLISIRRDDEYGDKIRIGLDAPSDVPIRREEVPDQRRAEPPVSGELRLEAVEDDTRRLRQKVDALGHQTARERQATALDAQRAGELADALVSLRRRCDELLERLNKTAARHDES